MQLIINSFSCLIWFNSYSVKDKWVCPSGQEEINSTEGGIRARKRRNPAEKGGVCLERDSSPERVALVIVLQLILVVLSQLSVPELPVHGAVLAHVNNVLIFIIVVVIVLTPQATFSDVNQLSVLEPAAGGAGVAAVGRRGGRAVAAVSAAAPVSPAGAQLLVAARGDVWGRALGAGVSDEEDDSHQSQHQQDAGDDEDSQVTSGLLFLLVPERQVGAEDALSWKSHKDRCRRTVPSLYLID